MFRLRSLIARERLPLVLFGVATVGLLLFMAIADEMREGETHALDRAILDALRAAGDPSHPFGPFWMQEMARDFTALGSTGVLALLTLGTVGALALAAEFRAALYTLFSIGLGTLLSTVLKAQFQRPRPITQGVITPESWSFPSGHAMMSAVVFLTLGALIAQRRREHRLRLYIIVVALGLSVLVGLTRIYLAVHWPTDVVAGWAVGCAWAIFCWLLAEYFTRRGQIDPPSGTPDG